MARVKKQSPRAYASAKRDEQARATRWSILQASRAQFLERGYGSTTMQAIADAAGVAVQTVYAVFGSKREVLKQLIDVSVVGDDAAVPLMDREATRAVSQEKDPRTRATMMAAQITTIMERTAPVAKIARDAASADDEAAAVYAAMMADRRQGMVRAAALLAGSDGLRVPTQEAAEILYALFGPDLAWLLMHDVGWTADRYEAWVADTLQRTLLVPRERAGHR
jgi:TetR/AcrR family transcriptional regulator of autoinduction and epiphytic fitness